MNEKSFCPICEKLVHRGGVETKLGQAHKRCRDRNKIPWESLELRWVVRHARLQLQKKVMESYFSSFLTPEEQREGASVRIRLPADFPLRKP